MPDIASVAYVDVGLVNLRGLDAELSLYPAPAPAYAPRQRSAGSAAVRAMQGRAICKGRRLAGTHFRARVHDAYRSAYWRNGYWGHAASMRLPKCLT